MKFVFFILVLCSLSFAEGEKKPLPLSPVIGSKVVANFNPNTGKIEPVKDATPDDVYDALIGLLRTKETQLQQCNAKLDPKPESVIQRDPKRHSKKG